MPIPAELFDFEGNQSSEQLKVLIQAEIEQYDPNRKRFKAGPQTTLVGTYDWLPVLTSAEFWARAPESQEQLILNSVPWQPADGIPLAAQRSSAQGSSVAIDGVSRFSAYDTQTTVRRRIPRVRQISL
ncbi:hypothetical protein I302_103122 [Kwoniella bestiolae CBS 10118]|uniref:Uncharacterized protein n=1 Tax=Kwoniella bestiolae CBS 10118 TaxID=1296100 RepID=A0A1B9GGZ2_9TREE|nr:hypothetical protein I302_01822 [Kwoniella bestiolae CBS 10118]OCF30303.1 hypothetical protein I302_01822 [Kwoniella bestiolae CBS 10118]